MNKKYVIDTINKLKITGGCFFIDGGYLATIPFDYKTKMPECIDLLSKWRIDNPSLSPQRFPVSNERTEKWLNKCILNNENRVMFMIRNSNNVSIGHIGLSEINYEKSIIRMDSVLRGVKGESPGIMGRSIDFLKMWCSSNLNAEYLDLIVLDDNTRAISLYQKYGFEYQKTIPLRRIEEDGETFWVEDYSELHPEKKYINMICKLNNCNYDK